MNNEKDLKTNQQLTPDTKDAKGKSISASMTDADWLEHDRTKDEMGRSKLFPNGEFIEGGWPE